MRPMEFGQYLTMRGMEIEERFKKECGTGAAKCAISVSSGGPTISDPLAEAGEVLTISLKQAIWYQELHRHPVQTPQDWWEHLKERWFPRWALRRWPVQYENYDVILGALYPQRKLKWPKSRVVYRYDTEKRPFDFMENLRNSYAKKAEQMLSGGGKSFVFKRYPCPKP